MNVVAPNRATPSVLLMAILVGSIVGVAVGSWATGWGGVAVGLMVAVMTAYLALLRADTADRLLVICVMITGFALGLGRIGLVGPSADSVARRVGSEREVQGTVVGRDTTETAQRLTLGDLVVDDVPVGDRVLASLPLYPRLMPGDRIELRCVLHQPEAFNGFAYDRYLAVRDIYATCRSFNEPFIVALDGVDSWRIRALRLREAAVERIERVFGEPHAALLSGLLFGTSRFSEEWTGRFSVTGTSHLVAASGYNVAIVATLLLTGLISVGLWRRHAFILVLGGLGVYAILAGAEPPVIRAAIMGALVLLARQAGRRTTMHNVFLLAVVAMLAFEPRLLRDDVGFQLSVVSTAGLLLWARPLERKLTFLTPFLGIRASLAATIAATVATLPIIVTNFGTLSFVAPIVNLLVLPLVPFAMGLGVLGAIGGVISALPAWLVLTTILQIIALLSELPFASWSVESWGARIAFVVLLASIVWIARRITTGVRLEVPTRSWRAVVGLITTLLVIVVLHRRSLISPAPLTVWFFDVGQGDAIFIDSPEKDVLIDGGPSSVVVEKLTSVLPPWDHAIDTLVVTHPDGDHRNGLADVARRYEINEVLTSGQADGSAFAQTMASAGVQRVIAAGDVIELGGDVRLRAVWPEAGRTYADANAGSIVFLLEFGETSVVLTGDAGVDQEKIFLDDLSHVDVLKAGHHGSNTSTGSELLSRITPDVVIISAGKDNQYGHPHQEVVARLGREGVEMFRTDADDDIRLTSDGGDPVVEHIPIW